MLRNRFAAFGATSVLNFASVGAQRRRERKQCQKAKRKRAQRNWPQRCAPRKTAAAIASLHLRDAVFVFELPHGPSEYGCCAFFAGRLRVFQLQRRKHCKIGGVTVEAMIMPSAPCCKEATATTALGSLNLRGAILVLEYLHGHSECGCCLSAFWLEGFAFDRFND